MEHSKFNGFKPIDFVIFKHKVQSVHFAAGLENEVGAKKQEGDIGFKEAGVGGYVAALIQQETVG